MRIYFNLLFVSCISFGFTQEKNANYIHADSAKYYISIYLNIHDLNHSNYEVKDQYAELPDIATLKELKFKKARNGFEFFAFKDVFKSLV